METFISQIIKNLEGNGFPEKRVSLPTEKMYEIADDKGLSLNKVLETLKNEHSIDSQVGSEKIIFCPKLEQAEGFGFDPSMMAKAKEMMDQMDPEQLAEIQQKVANMSDSEREELMNRAKGMGLF